MEKFDYLILLGTGAVVGLLISLLIMRFILHSLQGLISNAHHTEAVVRDSESSKLGMYVLLTLGTAVFAYFFYFQNLNEVPTDPINRSPVKHNQLSYYTKQVNLNETKEIEIEKNKSNFFSLQVSFNTNLDFAKKCKNNWRNKGFGNTYIISENNGYRVLIGKLRNELDAIEMQKRIPEKTILIRFGI